VSGLEEVVTKVIKVLLAYMVELQDAESYLIADYITWLSVAGSAGL